MAELYFNLSSDYQEAVKLRDEIIRLKRQLANADSLAVPEQIAPIEQQLEKATLRWNRLITEAMASGDDFRKNFTLRMAEYETRIRNLSEQIGAQKQQVARERQQLDVLNLQYSQLDQSADPADKEVLAAQIRDTTLLLDQEENTLLDLQKEQVEARVNARRLSTAYETYQTEGQAVISRAGSSTEALTGDTAKAKQSTAELNKQLEEQLQLYAAQNKALAGNTEQREKNIAAILAEMAANAGMSIAMERFLINLPKNLDRISKIPKIGAASAVIAALAFGIASMDKAVDPATKSLGKLNDRLKEVEKNKNSAISQTGALIGHINSENQSLEDQENAYRRLREIAPELKNISLDHFKSFSMEKQFAVMNDAIEEAELEAIEQLTKEAEERHKQLMEKANGFVSLADIEQLTPTGDNGLSPEQIKQFQEEATLALREKEALEGLLDIYKAHRTQKSGIDLTLPHTSATDTNKRTDNKKQQLDEEEKLNQKYLEAVLKLQEEELTLVKDGVEKRLSQARLEYQQKMLLINKEESEYRKAAEQAGVEPDENALALFDQRRFNAGQKLDKDTDILKIMEEQNKEIEKRAKDLTNILLSEEEKRLQAIEEKYRKEKEWAKEQLDNGSITEEQYDSYNEKIGKAQAEENIKALLDKYKDFTTQRLEIEKQFDNEIATLRAKQTADNEAQTNRAIAEAEKLKKQKLSALSLSELKDSNLGEKMFGDLDKLTAWSLGSILKQAKKVNTEAWDPAQIKEYEKAIKGLEDKLRKGGPFQALAHDWKNLMQALKNKDAEGMGNSLEGLGSVVTQISGDLNKLAGGIGDIFGEEAGYAAEQVAELTASLGGFLEGAGKIVQGDIVGGLASVVSGIGKVFKMGKNVRKMNEEARKQVEEQYDKAMEGEREYQALLRERARLEKQMGESSIQYHQRITSELQKQQKEVQSEYDKIWAQLQQENYISGVNYKHGTWFRKAKVTNEYDTLYGKSYEQIEQLYMQGNLDEKAKSLFEQLQKLKEEGADIDRMLAEQAQSFSEYLSGMTFDSLVGSIKDAFSDGKMDIEETADFTKEIFRKAILQALEAKVLEQKLQPFLESFQEDAVNGTLFDKMDHYESWINQIAEEGNAFMESVLSIPSLADLFAVDEAVAASDNSLRGAYAKASQESIDLLAGQTSAQRVAIEDIKTQVEQLREIQLKGWSEVTMIRELNQQIEDNTSQIAIHTNRIREISETISTHAGKSSKSLDMLQNHGIKINGL